MDLFTNKKVACGASIFDWMCWGKPSHTQTCPDFEGSLGKGSPSGISG